jgi:hypothetical protein
MQDPICKQPFKRVGNVAQVVEALLSERLWVQTLVLPKEKKMASDSQAEYKTILNDSTIHP